MIGQYEPVSGAMSAPNLLLISIAGAGAVMASLRLVHVIRFRAAFHTVGPFSAGVVGANCTRFSRLVVLGHLVCPTARFHNSLSVRLVLLLYPSSAMESSLRAPTFP